MFKSKVCQAIAAVALSLGAAGAANAFVITAGDYKFTIDNFDLGNVSYPSDDGVLCQGSTADCDAAGTSTGAAGLGSVDTAGIFSVALITNETLQTTVFTKGVDGYLTGIFGGLLDQTVENSCSATTNSCTTTALSVGGFFNMYQNAEDWDPTQGPAGDLNASIYPGISDGSLYLSGVFAPGAALGGDMTTSYVSTYNTSTFAGAGQGFLDLVGGSAYDTFNTNALTDANGNQRDLFLDVTFNNVNGVATDIGWTVKSTGAVSGQAVPEPGSLALIALALMGAGVATRRKA